MDTLAGGRRPARGRTFAPALWGSVEPVPEEIVGRLNGATVRTVPGLANYAAFRSFLVSGTFSTARQLWRTFWFLRPLQGAGRALCRNSAWWFHDLLQSNAGSACLRPRSPIITSRAWQWYRRWHRAQKRYAASLQSRGGQFTICSMEHPRSQIHALSPHTFIALPGSKKISLPKITCRHLEFMRSEALGSQLLSGRLNKFAFPLLKPGNEESFLPAPAVSGERAGMTDLPNSVAQDGIHCRWRSASGTFRNSNPAASHGRTFNGVANVGPVCAATR